MTLATKIPHSSTLPTPPATPKVIVSPREARRAMYERMARIPAGVSDSMVTLYLDTPVKLGENDVAETPRQIMAWAREQLAEMDREDAERAAKREAKRLDKVEKRAAERAAKEAKP